MLKENEKAPDFELKNQKGETIVLKNLKGKNIVLYFYPKDLTPGCTVEACDFNENLPLLKKKNTVVLGVSFDSEDLHKKFIAKHDLGFDRFRRWNVIAFPYLRFCPIRRAQSQDDDGGKRGPTGSHS